MPNSSTLSQALTDRLHEQAQTRETRYALLQNDARCRRAPAAEVYATYAFTRAENLCRTDAAGVCTQAAMTLTGPNNLTGPGEQLTVVAKIETNEEEEEETVWFLTDMTGLAFPASVYILAVQARLEATRRSN